MKLLLALAVALVPAPSKTLVYEDVVVAGTLPATVDCGVLKTWGAVDFTQAGVTSRAYVMCGLADRLPVVGAHCTMTVSVGRIDEIAPDDRKTPFTGYVVEAMTCDPKVAVSLH